MILKKYFFPCIIMCLLFVCPRFVSALSLSVPDSTFVFIEEHSSIYETMKTYADNYIANSDYNSYILTKDTSSDNAYYIVFINAVNCQWTYNSVMGFLNLGCSWADDNANNHWQRVWYKVSNNTFIPSTATNYMQYRMYIINGSVDYMNFLYFYSTNQYLLDGIHYETYNNPLTFSYLNTTYTTDYHQKFPSAYDLLEASVPPVPPDETPLLTSFFSICIDKLSYVSEYFVSNYIYLSIFVIFIFIFLIYLLKRRLF